MDPIYKGSAGQRVLTDMCIVAVNSNHVREDFLKKFEKKTDQQKKADYKDLNIDRAKTSIQLSRNNSLRKALELLKKENPKMDGIKIV